MKKTDFIKIINEEISDFDFLGNDASQKEQETIDLLRNEDFQKQFICDSLLSIHDSRKTERNAKIKISVTDANIGGDWEEYFDDASHITLEYFLNIQYKFDQNKEPVSFTLDFTSDRISISKGGYYDAGRLGGTPDTDIEPSGDAYYDYLDWSDIEVSLFTSDGDEIEFTAFKRAPQSIQILFIKEYTEDFITEKTMNIGDNSKEFKNLSKTPYC